MGKYITINSTSELDTTLKDNKYVLLDFWATWCPPCRAIAPLFEQLADQHTSEGGFAFAKVDVDSQQEIAKRYNITAMPTFVLLENGEVVNSLKGANARGINTFVTHALQGLEKDGAKQPEGSESKPIETAKA